MRRLARITGTTGTHCFELGEIVTLVNDDGTDMPGFRNARGLLQFVKLYNVEFIDEPNVDLRYVSTEKLLAEVTRRIRGGE